MIGIFFLYVWSQASLALACLGYGILTVVVSVVSQRTVTLSNWEPSFPLLLGNELTGGRPWRGRVFELFIANRAMSAAEIKETYLGGNIKARLGDSLLCLYRFAGGPDYPDEMGHLPALVWKGHAEAGNGYVVFGADRWLETAAPANHLTKRIVKASRFSLGITLASEETDQRGPARIVSVSADPMRRNFTLGQDASDLIFRLRTPFTGNNGGEPRLRAPGIFSNNETKHMVITYDGTDLLVYVNGSLNPNRLTLTPGVAVLSYFLGRSASRANLYTAIYYAMAFIPFGLLLSLTLKQSIQKDALRVGLSVLGVVLFASVMETALSAASNKAWQWGRLLLSSGLALIPVTLTEISLWVFRARFQAQSAH
jgi:hypothetical protein